MARNIPSLGKALFGKAARTVYRNLPVSDAAKLRLKDLVYRTFGFLIKDTPTYQHWHAIWSVMQANAALRSGVTPSAGALGRDDYRRRIAQEIVNFREVENVHDLPDIHHYWSNKYLKPKIEGLGLERIEDLYRNYIVDMCRCNPTRLVSAVSFGSGNCDTEVALAQAVLDKSVENFRIDCLDLNPEMLRRGETLAGSKGVAGYLGFIEADINTWQFDERYDVAIANQSLHHFVELETLFDKIKSAIDPDGVFITHDMIGRNGHMRWPEALVAIHEIWRKMPDRYKYNGQLKRFEKEFDNWDCSKGSFEGIRAQDILPLLIENFHFEVFFAFTNLIDVFIDRSFGPNLDPGNPEDLAFVDRVACLDEKLLDKGLITPTHLVAAMRLTPVETPKTYRHWTPNFCIRLPDKDADPRVISEIKLACDESSAGLVGSANPPAQTPITR